MLSTTKTTLPQMVVAPEQETRRVAFICSKSTLDMAYPALVMGWAALGNGIDVTIFFTFWGLDMISQNACRPSRNCPGRQPEHENDHDGVGYRKFRDSSARRCAPRYDGVCHKIDEGQNGKASGANRARIPSNACGCRRQTVCVQNVGGHDGCKARRFHRGRAGHCQRRRLYGHDRRRTDYFHLIVSAADSNHTAT